MLNLKLFFMSFLRGEWWSKQGLRGLKRLCAKVYLRGTLTSLQPRRSTRQVSLEQYQCPVLTASSSVRLCYCIVAISSSSKLQASRCLVGWKGGKAGRKHAISCSLTLEGCTAFDNEPRGERCKAVLSFELPLGSSTSTLISMKEANPMELCSK